MKRTGLAIVLLFAAGSPASAEEPGVVVAHLQRPSQQKKGPLAPPEALLWLEPLQGNVSAIGWPGKPPYRLLQKDKMFSPHLLVVPVGSSVAFPNADPFFHNVFSLFDGSRFDLGLYEAGSTRDVRFSRKGFSFIFCNIHPEMAAIVVALDTPLWTSSSNGQDLLVTGVPAGMYRAHLWIEGQDAKRLEAWTHTVTVGARQATDSGTFVEDPARPNRHLNEFGKQYTPERSPY